MPFKDPKSEEAIKSRDECQRRYYIKHREEISEKNKQNPKRIKASRINVWKGRGVIGNYDELYDKYINAECCEKCNVKFDMKYIIIKNV